MGQGALDVGGGDRRAPRRGRGRGALPLRESAASLAWCEGRLLAADDPIWPALDRLALYGDGLFETFLVSGGRPVWWTRHMARFRRSARALGFPGPEELARRAGIAARFLLRSDPGQALLRRHRGRAVLRVTWSRGPGARGYAPPSRTKPALVAHLSPVGPPVSRVRAILAHGLVPGSLAQHKTCSRIVQVEAARRARRAGVEEALLEDGAGGLAEATAANLFLLREGKLVTPPTTAPLLPGVVRAWVLARARRDRALRGRVLERRVTLRELLAADEAFLTSSVRGIVSLVEVEGEAIGRQGAGRTTRALARALRAELGES